ncbi:hypothetical protein WH47_04743 [Habropoda laboriosa]|uniref:C2H2-type domain-containing protein n=1 Tax=Habropoda laboriosa TaxID=597456 RepID=A0A0L7QXK8_9HYME|nr:hypothetical protein WH47_04743 [Habropoda laboriosa]
MGTLWIVCAESKHDTTPFGNHRQRQLDEQQQQQQQQQQSQQLEQQQQHQQQQTSHGYERIRRRSKPLHDETGRWVCDVCGRTYNPLVIRRNKFIEAHARIPAWSLHSPGSFCDKCGVTFTTQHALLRHITSKHEEPQSSTAYCNICQRFFKTKWSLATHNSKYHRN